MVLQSQIEIGCSDQTARSWEREHCLNVSLCPMPRKIHARGSNIWFPKIEYYILKGLPGKKS